MSEVKIHPSAIVEDASTLGPGTSIWHFCHVRAGARTGKSVSIGKGVYLDSEVSIGDGSRVQNGVNVFNGVEIGNWCFVGPNVVFTNDMFPRAGTREWEIVSTVLEDGASLGAGAVIRCGITIGAYAMVACGAVVTRSVPPFHLAKGLPAQVTHKICACGYTMLPLHATRAGLLRDCCDRRMHPESMAQARAILDGLEDGWDAAASGAVLRPTPPPPAQNPGRAERTGRALNGAPPRMEEPLL